MIMSLLGLARPVSTKLRCREETFAAMARSSWLSLRRCRHSRSRSPACVVMIFLRLPGLPRRLHYLGGNCRASLRWAGSNAVADYHGGKPDAGDHRALHRRLERDGPRAP